MKAQYEEEIKVLVDTAEEETNVLRSTIARLENQVHQQPITDREATAPLKVKVFSCASRGMNMNHVTVFIQYCDLQYFILSDGRGGVGP